MKSTQLLSAVLSLIMVFGVTAGSAFAQTDDDAETVTNNYTTETDIDIKEDIDEDVDDLNDGKLYDLDDRLEYYCSMTDEEKRQFFEDHPRLEQFSDRLSNYCEMTDEEREIAIDEFIREHVPEARDHDKYLEDKLDRYCEMTDEEKQEVISKYNKAEDHVTEMNRYCSLDDNDRDTFIDENKDKFRMHYEKNMSDMLMRYCEMTEEDKSSFLAEHNKTEDHAEKMNTYCSLDEDARMNFIEEHRDEYKKHMKDKMMDKPHMDYDRICSLSESDRAVEIVDAEKLERISKWCDMTLEEREEYKKEHRDSMKDKMMDNDNYKMDKVHDKMKLSDMSPRLKEMIMTKHDISDEKREEIKMKYIEKHGELTDERKSELKMKFKEYMTSKRINMSDERKSEIHDRIAEMKAFKAELRERASEMTDEEKQELREEFIETAKDIQLAWISPHHQMNVGINADEIDCREGFSLVLKASNGVPMCLKSNTALKMIERGIAVPAN